MQFYALDHAGVEELVAGLHIRQVQVGEHVASEREPLVPDAVPKEQDAVWAATHEAGAIDHIGKARDYGPQQHVVFLRVILQVRILDDEVLARGLADACM